MTVQCCTLNPHAVSQMAKSQPSRSRIHGRQAGKHGGVHKVHSRQNQEETQLDNKARPQCESHSRATVRFDTDVVNIRSGNLSHCLVPTYYEHCFCGNPLTCIIREKKSKGALSKVCQGGVQPMIQELGLLLLSLQNKTDSACLVLNTSDLRQLCEGTSVILH